MWYPRVVYTVQTKDVEVYPVSIVTFWSRFLPGDTVNDNSLVSSFI